MSTDKPSAGDRRPDQAPRPEHRPFPGQPDNRPPVPPPTGPKTADQMRAERAKYKTNSEYNAAKAAERAAARQAGAVPGGAPVRGDSGGRNPAVSPDRNPAPRPDAPGTRRPDGLARPDRARARPFPGQPDNRPPVPPPTGTKTADQMRAERAKYKTNSEYNAAKAAEKAAARQAAGSGPGEAVGVSSDRASVTQAARPGPGGVGRHDDIRHPVLHWKGTFHGVESEFYSSVDGKDWTSGAAMRAATAGNETGKAGTEKPGITSLPQQRDLGDNTTGENPNVRLGDTTDLRTYGEKMTGEPAFGKKPGETDGSPESRTSRAFDVLFERADDLHDGSGAVGEAVVDSLPPGQGPTGSHALHSGHPGYEAAPSQGLNVSDAVGGTVLAVVAAVTAGRHMIESRRRDH